MSILARMLIKMVLVRFLAIIVGISLFVLTLEVVTYAKEITALQPDDPQMIVRYLFMRMPATLATFLPMSLLLAMLLTITSLSLRSETVAIWATGISPGRVVMMLWPIIIGCGALNFLLLDRGVPFAAPILRQWAIADYGKKQLNVGEDDPIWLRNGMDVLRAKQASSDSSQLKDVLVFRRDANGLLIEQIAARSGEKLDSGWLLKGATRFGVDGNPPVTLSEIKYEGLVRPAAAGLRSGDPEEMGIDELDYFISNSGFGIRPTYVYTTWWHKRLSSLLTAFVVVALCLPFAASFRRGGGLGVLFAAGVGLGFLYFIFDGIFLSLGVLGFVPPWLASWVPNMAFGALAILLLLRRERLAAR
jgi:lipopolysaccharide export system permease protein